MNALHVIDGTCEALPENAIVVLSEPLDELLEHWETVPESSFLSVEHGETKIASFLPRSAS